MAAKSSDLDDQISGTNLQIEGHIPRSPSGQKGLKEIGSSGSVPSHSPSWSLERPLLPGCPETLYCLEMCATLTNERGAVAQPPHAWMVPVVMDMLQHGRTGLTKAIVMGP